jgi:hypothetical protein
MGVNVPLRLNIKPRKARARIHSAHGREEEEFRENGIVTGRGTGNCVKLNDRFLESGEFGAAMTRMIGIHEC